MYMNKKSYKFIITLLAIMLVMVNVVHGVGEPGIAGDSDSNKDGITEDFNANAASKIDKVVKNKLANKGNTFVSAGNKHKVDAYLLAAIAIHETGNGKSDAIVDRNNVGGYMKKKGGLQNFESVDASIYYGADLLAGKMYIGGGNNTLKKIRAVYAPDGAGNDPNNLNANWVSGVKKYYEMIAGEPPGVFSLTWSGENDGAGPMPTDESIEEGSELYQEFISSIDESTNTGIYYEQTPDDIIVNYKFYKVVKFIITVINKIIIYLAWLGMLFLAVFWGMYAVALSGVTVFAKWIYKFTNGRIDTYASGSLMDMIVLSLVISVLLALVLTGFVANISEKLIIFILSKIFR